jgi:hypothetical protein
VGLYSFTALVAGNYRFSATFQGFRTIVRDSVPVEIDRVSEVNLELNSGDVTETVTVEGEPALTNTTSSTIGQLIANKTLNSLPLNGRNVF